MIMVTKSPQETKKLASRLAETIRSCRNKKTVVLALEGELGSGKTTFAQGVARALGVREKILSPTFVLLKIYKLSPGIGFKHLVHIDCYRLDSYKDLLHLGFQGLFKNRDAIVLIEWANRVRKIIPRDAIWIKFKHDYPRGRILTFSDAEVISIESKNV